MRPLLITTVTTSLLVLAACGIGLEANNGWDSAEEPLYDGLTIVSISPDWGPTYGGTDVTITLANFEGTAEVFFGNAVLPVTAIDAETIQVTSPNAGAAFAVDVTVRTETDEAVLPAGFTFSDTGPPPDTGGDTDDPPVGPTGLVGGFIELSRTQIACPSCLGFPGEFSVQAGAAFHAPITGSWDDWMPPQGQCVLNPSSSPPVGAFVDVGDYAYLKSGSTTIPLIGSPSSTGAGMSYTADNLPVNDYIANGAYNLDVPGSGTTAGFNIVGAVQAAEGYTGITPYEMMYSGEAGSFQAQVSSAGQTFTWAPAGSGDGFVIDIGVYDYYSGAPLGTLFCHGPDTGSMYIPMGDYMDAPLLLTVGMYRRKKTTAINPVDGSTIEAVATAGFLGTAVMEY